HGGDPRLEERTRKYAFGSSTRIRTHIRGYVVFTTVLALRRIRAVGTDASGHEPHAAQSCFGAVLMGNAARNLPHHLYDRVRAASIHSSPYLVCNYSGRPARSVSASHGLESCRPSLVMVRA